jgi:hypothetical protein
MTTINKKPTSLSADGLSSFLNRSTTTLQHSVNYFLNLLLAYPANPINPDPSSNIVVGSGTAVT